MEIEQGPLLRWALIDRGGQNAGPLIYQVVDATPPFPAERLVRRVADELPNGTLGAALSAEQAKKRKEANDDGNGRAVCVVLGASRTATVREPSRELGTPLWLRTRTIECGTAGPLTAELHTTEQENRPRVDDSGKNRPEVAVRLESLDHNEGPPVGPIPRADAGLWDLAVAEAKQAVTRARAGPNGRRAVPALIRSEHSARSWQGLPIDGIAVTEDRGALARDWLHDAMAAALDEFRTAARQSARDRAAQLRRCRWELTGPTGDGLSSRPYGRAELTLSYDGRWTRRITTFAAHGCGVHEGERRTGELEREWLHNMPGIGASEEERR